MRFNQALLALRNGAEIHREKWGEGGLWISKETLSENFLFHGQDIMATDWVIRESENMETDSDLPANVDRLNQAKRFALQRFEEWNDVTGFVTPHTGYYYEICGLIEDAAEFGFGVAHGQTHKEILKRIENE